MSEQSESDPLTPLEPLFSSTPNQIPIQTPGQKILSPLLICLIILAVSICSIALWENFGREKLISTVDTTQSVASHELTIAEAANTETPGTTPLTQALSKQTFPNIKGLGSRFWISRRSAQANSERLFVAGHQDGRSTLGYSNLKTDQTVSSFSEIMLQLPARMSDSRMLLDETKLFLSGFESQPEDQEQVFGLKTPSFILSTDIQADGAIQQWKKIGSLPERVPVENGGYILLAHKHSLLTVVIVDAVEYPLYRAEINTDGSLSPWVLIGTLPVGNENRAQLDYTMASNDSSYSYGDDQAGETLQVITVNSIDTYRITDRNLTKISSQSLVLPTGLETSYMEPIYTFKSKGSFYLAKKAVSGNERVIELWKAEQIGTGFSFKKIDSVNVPSYSGSGEYSFTNNDQNLFTIIQTGDLNASNHILITLPLK